MGNHDTKVGDWVGCFPPGGQSLNQDLGNHKTKVFDWIGCFPPGGKSLN